MSCVPLGKNYIPINRALTTTATAIFVPFTTQELFQEGEALYYGLNGVSNNMIMVDRKKLKNPNGLILGTPGSGKSFSAKREMTNAFLVTNDDIIVCDPEGEYYPLVNKMQGQVIRISPTSKDYVNPMDINLDYSDDENPLALKSDFILSLCELIMGGKTGLEAVEISMIDRCLPIVYQKYFANPIPGRICRSLGICTIACVLRKRTKHSVSQRHLKSMYTAVSTYSITEPTSNWITVSSASTSRSLESSLKRSVCLSYRIRCGTE